MGRDDRVQDSPDRTCTRLWIAPRITAPPSGITRFAWTAGTRIWPGPYLPGCRQAPVAGAAGRGLTDRCAECRMVVAFCGALPLECHGMVAIGVDLFRKTYSLGFSGLWGGRMLRILCLFGWHKPSRRRMRWQQELCTTSCRRCSQPLEKRAGGRWKRRQDSVVGQELSGS